jgi:hypothetical protein
MRDRPEFGLPGLEDLVEIKVAQTQVLQCRWIPDAERNEAGQQQKADRATDAEPVQDAVVPAQRDLLFALLTALFPDFQPLLVEAAELLFEIRCHEGRMPRSDAARYFSRKARCRWSVIGFIR